MLGNIALHKGGYCMLNLILGIVLFSATLLFLGYQVYGLVKKLIKRSKNKNKTNDPFDEVV